MDLLGFAVAESIVALLAASGTGKLVAGRFAGDLANYRLVPTSWVVSAAAILPWIEIGLGAGLLLTPWTRLLLIAAAGLLAVFTAAVTINLARGRRIACGCRGGSKPISWALAATNTAWILLALVAALVGPPSPAAVLVGSSPALTAGDGLAVLLTLLLATVILRLVLTARQLSTAAGDATPLTQPLL